MFHTSSILSFVHTPTPVRRTGDRRTEGGYTPLAEGVAFWSEHSIKHTLIFTPGNTFCQPKSTTKNQPCRSLKLQQNTAFGFEYESSIVSMVTAQLCGSRLQDRSGLGGDSPGYS
jgi:hypothetical protein